MGLPLLVGAAPFAQLANSADASTAAWFDEDAFSAAIESPIMAAFQKRSRNLSSLCDALHRQESACVDSGESLSRMYVLVTHAVVKAITTVYIGAVPRERQTSAALAAVSLAKILECMPSREYAARKLSHLTLCIAALASVKLLTHLTNPSMNPCDVDARLSDLRDVELHYAAARAQREYAYLKDTLGDAKLVSSISSIRRELHKAGATYVEARVTLAQLRVLVEQGPWDAYVK